MDSCVHVYVRGLTTGRGCFLQTKYHLMSKSLMHASQCTNGKRSVASEDKTEIIETEGNVI